MEWLAWQHQQIATLTAGTPMLYSHAEELDINEKVEVERVLEFLGITGHRHVVGKPVVTAEAPPAPLSPPCQTPSISPGVRIVRWPGRESPAPFPLSLVIFLLAVGFGEEVG